MCICLSGSFHSHLGFIFEVVEYLKYCARLFFVRFTSPEKAMNLNLRL